MVDWSEVCDCGGLGLLLCVKYVVFDWLVYCKLCVVLGGNCCVVVFGGVLLGVWFGYFYCGVGFIIYEGYGLSGISGGVVIS